MWNQGASLENGLVESGCWAGATLVKSEGRISQESRMRLEVPHRIHNTVDGTCAWFLNRTEQDTVSVLE